jgi:hypothetical protein
VKRHPYARPTLRDRLITGGFMSRLTPKQIARLLKLSQAEVEDAIRRGSRG